jgi:hypothetical protein
MVAVDFVYPNVPAVSQRGGLLERWNRAREAGCTYVEVPADMVKNRTEVERTGQDIGSFLSRASIEEIYVQDEALPKGVRYILHTEPSVPRTDQYGLMAQTPLRWYDDAWVTAFVDMMIEIQDFLGRPAEAIEIHSGDRRNSFTDIALAVSSIVEAHHSAFGQEPLVLMVNRPGQVVSDGGTASEAWHYVSENLPELLCSFGLALDLHHLYTARKGDLIPSLRQVPPEAVAAFHIHYRHQLPSPYDPLPWTEVFDYIRGIEGRVLIKTEIRRADRVGEAVAFCRPMLAR